MLSFHAGLLTCTICLLHP
uniref:Uncharacterized protein n=1 Tax=Rhizophora mucronata TaxID=61149 RepID=A0A2P2NIR3_RHIMU